MEKHNYQNPDLIGAALNTFRADMNISQEKLALDSGVPQYTISKYETGDIRNPSNKIIKQLLDALGVSLERFQRRIRNIADGTYLDILEYKAEVVENDNDLLGRIALFDDEVLIELKESNPELIRFATILDLELREKIRRIRAIIVGEIEEYDEGILYKISSLFEEYRATLPSSKLRLKQKEKLKQQINSLRNDKSKQEELKELRKLSSELSNSPRPARIRKGASSSALEELLLFCLVKIIYQKPNKDETKVNKIDVNINWDLIAEILIHIKETSFLVKRNPQKKNTYFLAYFNNSRIKRNYEKFERNNLRECYDQALKRYDFLNTQLWSMSFKSLVNIPVESKITPKNP